MVDLPSYGPTNRIRLGSFLRSRPLFLNYTGNERLIDFQIKCVLTPADIPFEKLRADKQDLLFVDNNNEPIPYWIEKADSIEIIVWLKFSEITPGTEVFWLYYGNGNFLGESNVSTTFIRVIDGLIGAWHFDEESGNIAYDSSGNGRNGTIYGAARADGRFGKALDFDGDDYVDCGDGDFLNGLSAFSITAWVKSEVTGVDAAIWCGHETDYMVLRYDAQGWEGGGTNVILFYFNTAEGGKNRYESASNVQTTNWQHIAAIWNGTDLRMYINGEEDTPTYKNPGTGVSTGADRCQFGRRGTTYYWDGLIDEVCIYNRALTSDEISDLYNNYGYTTENCPGKVLIRKYAEIQPKIIV